MFRFMNEILNKYLIYLTVDIHSMAELPTSNASRTITLKF